MEQHTFTLQEEELRLFKILRKVKHNKKIKDELIEKLIQDIQDFLTTQSLPKKEIKLLQKGKRKGFRPFHPIKLEPDTPLASEIIMEQRKCLSRSEP